MLKLRAAVTRCLVFVAACGLSISTLVFAGTATAAPRAQYWGAATWSPIYYSVRNVSCQEALRLLKAIRWEYSNKITVRGWACRTTPKSQVTIDGYPVGQSGAKCSRGNQRVFIGYGD